MTAWHDPFGERIKANVRQCDKCGTELDEGDNAYFTGLDMLCLDCAEAAARAQAEQDTVETIQTRFHAMEQRGLTRRDTTPSWRTGKGRKAKRSCLTASLRGLWDEQDHEKRQLSAVLFAAQKTRPRKNAEQGDL